MSLKKAPWNVLLGILLHQQGCGWNISREKGQLCLWATPVVEAACLWGFRTQTLVPSQKIVKTLLWMAYGQQLCDFSGEKPAGSASASSWCVWHLVNVSTLWGVTGTERAVHSLTAKYFKAQLLIYCSLQVKQIQNIWFWHPAWLCKDCFSKTSCVNLMYMLNLDMPEWVFLYNILKVWSFPTFIHINGFAATVGHEVYLIRKEK